MTDRAAAAPVEIAARDTPTPPGAPDPWQALRAFTPARIALGRAGSSLPTRAHLDFQLAHARARDAVHDRLDVPALRAALSAAGLESLVVRSAAADRATYLQRPDLGRRLDDDARERLAAGGGTASRPRSSWPTASLRARRRPTPSRCSARSCPGCATRAGASRRS